MANYISKQDILDAALGEFIDYGFTLQEPDDQTTELFFKDKCIARYNKRMVTIDIIREGCQNYIKSMARWTEA